MLTNTRNYLKSQLGRFYLTNLLYTLKPNNRKLIIHKNKDLCIEGYPRSANTFGVLLVEQCSKKKLNIAHHMHSSSQIVQAVKWNIPSVLLLRNPKDAVISNLLREEGMKAEVALNWYINFHKDLIHIKGNLIVWEFKEFVNRPLDCLAKLTTLSGLKMDQSLYNKDEIYRKIDELDRIYKKSADFNKINTRPNENKGDLKRRLEVELTENQSLKEKFEQAQYLYESFL